MKKSKLIILIVVIALLALVIAYLLYSNFATDRITPLRSLGLDGEMPLISTLNTTFETDFLNKSPYTDLEQSGELPVEVKKRGRENPFQEINFFPEF